MKYFSILLKSDEKRFNHVISNTLRNIPSLEIVEAIEGKTNELEYYLKNREIQESFLNICKRGQLGCLLSHIKVWQQMIDENILEAVILEDDAKIETNFITDFTSLNISKDIDFVYLFVHPDSYIKNEEKELKLLEGYKTYGTVAYYIKKELAKELILFFENKIYHTLDESISWYLETYEKKYLCVSKNIVDTIGSLYFQRNDSLLGSLIGETDLYKGGINISPSFFFEEGNYLVYPNCTISDGNIFFDPSINSEKYINDSKILGFTSDGWVKNKITSNWKFKRGVNLYIKKKRGDSILITGGAGFIGSHFVLEFLKREKFQNIVILDDLSNSNIDIIKRLKLFSKGNLFFYPINIKKKKELRGIFSNFNIKTVIHFAAYKSVGESVLNPLKYYDNNIIGLINLLKIMEEFNVKNIIFSSSATVYGNPESLPLTEKSKINILNPYGRTKFFAEEILKDMKNMKAISLRYFNPVGCSNFGIIKETPKGIPNNLFPYILSVIKGEREKLFIYGGDYETPDGTGIRDYIHVSDLAKAHIAALDYLRKDFKYEVINLGTGKGYSVLKILNTFSQILGRKIPYEIIDRREGDSAEVYTDSSKALTLLNWKAELTLEDMISSSLKGI